MDGSSIYTWFAWIMKHKINFMNDVCLLFNQYDYACNCDYIFRAQKSPLELWAFVYCSTVHIYSHFSIKCYLFNRGSVIKLIIYVTWTFRMLYLFGEGSELKFICATFICALNGTINYKKITEVTRILIFEYVFFHLIFFAPSIHWHWSNCQFFSREFSIIQDYSLFFHVQC